MAPTRTMFDTLSLPSSWAMSSAGTSTTTISLRLRAEVVRFTLRTSTPPLLSSGVNFLNDVSFMTMRPSDWRGRGETISSSETMTVHLALPPRCSGP